MSNKGSIGSPFHALGVNATGFLGGITFATMILIIGLPTKLQYSEIIISATAIVSVLFIMATLGMMRVASGIVSENTDFSKYMEGFAGAGFWGLMAILPAIVLQFSVVGGIVIIFTEAVLIIIFFTFLKKAK